VRPMPDLLHSSIRNRPVSVAVGSILRNLNNTNDFSFFEYTKAHFQPDTGRLTAVLR